MACLRKNSGWLTRNGSQNRKRLKVMLDARQETGRRGEDLAAAFLMAKGFSLVERNWRCRAGEIDLIVRRDQEVRFVEVKTRFSTTYGFPEEAITQTKKHHLVKAIDWWLLSHPVPKHYQLDVISILTLPGQKPDICWIEAI
ncbi:YraN family protein [Candidatus Uhrbacteria bacterium]|nr:YraN family protein [Candidatus Uhrbacteria bacterium]